MRRGFTLVVLLLAAIAAVYVASEEVHVPEVVEAETETLNAQEEEPKIERLDSVIHISQEEFLSRLTKRCRAEYAEHPQSPEELSPRCRNEIAMKVQRQLAKEKREAEGETAEDKAKAQAKKAKPQKLTKKQKRANRRRAMQEKQEAEAKKAEEAYNDTVKIIAGFVVTFVAVIVGAILVINRKLKDAGMYYPADPMAKASCCGGGCD